LIYFLLLTFLRNPTYDFLLLNYRFPFLWIPLEFRSFLICDTWGAADKNDAWLIAFFDLNKAKNKYIGIATYKALYS